MKRFGLAKMAYDALNLGIRDENNNIAAAVDTPHYKDHHGMKVWVANNVPTLWVHRSHVNGRGEFIMEHGIPIGRYWT